MKKKVLALLICAMVSVNMLAGCGSSDDYEESVTQEEVTEEETEEFEEDSTASDEAVSDESFEALQEAYAYLVEEYDMIVDEYMNNDNVEQNSDLESYLSEAKDLIEQMGEIERSSLSEADAATLAESMTTIANSLAEVAEQVF